MFARQFLLCGLIMLVPHVDARSEDAHAAPQGWTLFRGGPGSAAVANTKLPASPEVVWQYKVPEGSFESTAVIVDAPGKPPMVVIGDLDGSLFALQLDSGEKLWEYDVGELGFTAAPAYRSGKFYIGDLDGFFHCLDRDGKPIWKYTADVEISGSANFYKSLVLFGAQDGCLHAVDQETGKLVWKYQADDQIQCSTTVVGAHAFLAGCDGKLHIVDLTDGKSAEKVDIGGPTGTTPAALGDRVFFGTQQGTFWAVDVAQAKVAWQRDDPLGGTTIVASAAVDDRQVVFGLRNRQVVSLDPASGKERWTAKLKNKIDSSPVIVGDQVLAASVDGRLYLLDQKDGHVTWQTQLNGAIIGSPAVAFERLVVATDRGVVYCLGAPKTK